MVVYDVMQRLKDMPPGAKVVVRMPASGEFVTLTGIRPANPEEEKGLLDGVFDDVGEPMDDLDCVICLD